MDSGQLFCAQVQVAGALSKLLLNRILHLLFVTRAVHGMAMSRLFLQDKGLVSQGGIYYSDVQR